MPLRNLPDKLGRGLTWVIILGLMGGGVMLVVAAYTGLAVLATPGGGGLPLDIDNNPSLNPEIKADAARVARDFCADTDAAEDFRRELLALYLEAEGKDVVMVFNPGGWGTKSLTDSPGWQSIADGIAAKLEAMGYDLLTLDYHRTEENLLGIMNEISQMAGKYGDKAQEMALRMDFLTRHRPSVTVVLAAESNGLIISDQVMLRLRDNCRVSSIGTGPPFWYRCQAEERVLILNSNGREPDTFSRGNFAAMIRANLGALLGVNESIPSEGDVFNIVLAPGHHYNWQYPQVADSISAFLERSLN